MDHVILSSWNTSQEVQNGEIYETGEIPVDSSRVLVVPHQAQLQRGDEGGIIRVFTRKCLSYGGHPSVPLSIVSIAPRMGVALKGNEAVYGLVSCWRGWQEVNYFSQL